MKNPTALPHAKLIKAVIWLALGYYAAGRLGLMLAIPPGYATAVWPASGIALAGLLMTRGRAWMGVWIGSFGVNVTTGLDASSLPDILRSLPLPMLIASGATLQAWAGQALIRRVMGDHVFLNRESHTVGLLLLGGPVSCVISASVGVTTLTQMGLVPTDNFLFNWWTWWVGDSIGVLIFTPLLLLWSQGKGREFMGRRLLITLPMMAMFAVVVALFVYVSRLEQASIQSRFDRSSDDLQAHIDRQLDQRLDSLRAVRAFMSSNELTTQAEFTRFVRRVMARRPDIQAISWNPIVAADERSAYEAQMRAQGYPGFEIWEQNESGRRVSAQGRKPYVAVTWIVPMQKNGSALGFDVGSEAHRLAAMQAAHLEGDGAATSSLKLAQAGSGFLVFMPVYRQGAEVQTPAQRARAVVGYVVGVFNAEFMLKGLLDRQIPPGLDVLITEETHSSHLRLFQHGQTPTPQARGFYREVEQDFAGRRWTLEMAFSESHLQAHHSWQVWTLLAAGMLFTGLLGILLLVLVGRTERVRALVQERTEQLAREVERSATLEQETRLHAQDLESSNRELEQFAYAVSHDLQAPLRGISSFARLLEKRAGAVLDESGREFITLIRDSAADMGRLIEDLLGLSRVSAQRAEMGVIATADAMKKACDLLRSDMDACGGLVEHGELPEVRGDMRLQIQLFQNLIGNGLKFRRAGVPPKILVQAQRKDGEWLFSVRDNGIGIASQNIPRLFQIFKRLHTQDQYPGSGIGLALCRKIVALHGGRIWMESEVGAGTTIYFTLVPAQGFQSTGRHGAVER